MVIFCPMLVSLYRLWQVFSLMKHGKGSHGGGTYLLRTWLTQLCRKCCFSSAYPGAYTQRTRAAQTPPSSSTYIILKVYLACCNLLQLITVSVLPILSFLLRCIFYAADSSALVCHYTRHTRNAVSTHLDPMNDAIELSIYLPQGRVPSKIDPLIGEIMCRIVCEVKVVDARVRGKETGLASSDPL